MPDRDDARPAPPRTTRRPRRFSLPEHHHEEEHEDRIEAFLEHPTTRRRRSRAHRPAGARRIEFEAPEAWSGTVQREAVRQARYGRPMAILVMDLTVDAEGARRPDERLVEVLRREARETDRATRTEAGRLLVLLPETAEADASHLATRIDRAYRQGHDEPRETPRPALRIEIAFPRRGDDPRHEIGRAEARLDEGLG